MAEQTGERVSLTTAEMGDLAAAYGWWKAHGDPEAFYDVLDAAVQRIMADAIRGHVEAGATYAEAVTLAAGTPADVPAEQAALTEDEREALDQSLADSGCHGFLGDHPDLYAAVARILADRILAAEQRGREDNEDHDQCYTYGSKALAALEAAAVQRGRTEALGEVERVAALIHEMALSACVCGGVAACFTCQTADEAVHILTALTPTDEGGGR